MSDFTRFPRSDLAYSRYKEESIPGSFYIPIGHEGTFAITRARVIKIPRTASVLT
jgi:hypothetical protein